MCSSNRQLWVPVAEVPTENWQRLVLCVAILLGMLGCGGPRDQPSPQSIQPTQTQETSPVVVDRSTTRPDPTTKSGKLPTNVLETPTSPSKPPDLPDEIFERPSEAVDAHEPSNDRITAAGIRKLVSSHLTLYTDLPSNDEVDALPRIFDLAIVEWCKYFSVDAQATQDWHLRAYLMSDGELFRDLDFMPDDLPPFLHGYQRGNQLWMYEQPSVYYRRHLLLHEGTHGFMAWAFGGCGPPWYMEGVAELLATHHWDGSKLRLNYFPLNKTETPQWGRIKVIRDQWAAGDGKGLAEIMRYDTRAHLEVAPYAWSWAAALFFDRHVEAKDRFDILTSFANDPTLQFSQRFVEKLDDDWPWLLHQWQNFIAHLDYGYESERELLPRRRELQALTKAERIDVAADRGWQSSGLLVQAGATYRIEAEGRFQLATEPQIWWSEPNGVTIQYYNGLPVGLLMVAIVDESQAPEGPSPLARPDPIGLGRTAKVENSGVLYFRINEDPADWHNNRGEITVQVSPVP